MHTNPRISDKGQASILLALAFVALLGFTALAIDGGMVYSNRRHAQNASDAASLAGGSAAALWMENHYVDYSNFDCSNGRVEAAQNNAHGAKKAAIDRAGGNDFEIDTDIADRNGVTTDCVDSYDNGSWVEKYLDVITNITTDTNTAFAHFVFGGPLRNSVEAVARVRPRMPVAFGNAIVSLAMTCDAGGIDFDGTNVVHVTGGGIFSNSCIGTNGTVGVSVEGEYKVSCALTDCYTDNGASGTVSPPPEEGTGVTLPPSAFAVPSPVCDGLPNRGNYNQDGNVEYGSYTNIRIQNGDHTIDPGLYCVSGEVVVNGGTFTGSGVTFYLTSGDFSTSGNATTRLLAPNSRHCGDPCSTYHALPGVLVYLAQGNTGEATLLGTGDSEFTGLVYVPDGTIEAGGTSSDLGVINAQLVGKDVKIHGNTAVEINFNDQTNYQLPAAIELNR
ncbi:MAG TPA: pilus assembly protein TadG-related protein [Anaerolineales bacterium]|nr:pilus assembly protein TadG-related protein [Anaerolineales bacterium]